MIPACIQNQISWVCSNPLALFAEGYLCDRVLRTSGWGRLILKYRSKAWFLEIQDSLFLEYSRLYAIREQQSNAFKSLSINLNFLLNKVWIVRMMAIEKECVCLLLVGRLCRGGSAPTPFPWVLGFNFLMGLFQHLFREGGKREDVLGVKDVFGN